MTGRHLVQNLESPLELRTDRCLDVDLAENSEMSMALTMDQHLVFRMEVCSESEWDCCLVLQMELMMVK